MLFNLFFREDLIAFEIRGDNLRIVDIPYKVIVSYIDCHAKVLKHRDIGKNNLFREFRIHGQSNVCICSLRHCRAKHLVLKRKNDCLILNVRHNNVLRMRKNFSRFASFIVSVCLLLSLNAADSLAAKTGPQAELDSLCLAALDHTNHGRFVESNSIITGILKEFRLSKESKATMYGILGQNAWLSGDYALYYKYLSKSLKPKELKALRLQKALSRLPRESITRPDEDVHIKYMVDSLFFEGEFKGFEMRLPTEIGGKQEMMILDNGCAFFSLASESFAKEHGIHPIGIQGKASGTVDKVSMWMGIADSLRIESLQFQDILFTVIPDEFLQNPVTKIDAALGANIFRLVGQMDFDNVNKEIVIPFEQDEYESNVTINGNGCHYVDAVVGNDTLKFQLDLGASSSQLNSNYFTKYEEQIIKEYATDTSMFGGVGGMSSEPVYRIDNVEIKACGGCFTKQNIRIGTTKKSNEGDEFGVLGLDFLLFFDHSSLNLRKMYLKL